MQIRYDNETVLALWLRKGLHILFRNWYQDWLLWNNEVWINSPIHLNAQYFITFPTWQKLPWNQGSVGQGEKSNEWISLWSEPFFDNAIEFISRASNLCLKILWCIDPLPDRSVHFWTPNLNQHSRVVNATILSYCPTFQLRNW